MDAASGQGPVQPAGKYVRPKMEETEWATLSETRTTADGFSLSLWKTPDRGPYESLAKTPPMWRWRVKDCQHCQETVAEGICASVAQAKDEAENALLRVRKILR